MTRETKSPFEVLFFPAPLRDPADDPATRGIFDSLEKSLIFPLPDRAPVGMKVGTPTTAPVDSNNEFQEYRGLTNPVGPPGSPAGPQIETTPPYFPPPDRPEEDRWQKWYDPPDRPDEWYWRVLRKERADRASVPQSPDFSEGIGNWQDASATAAGSPAARIAGLKSGLLVPARNSSPSRVSSTGVPPVSDPTQEKPGGILGMMVESGLLDPRNPDRPPPGGLLGLMQEYMRNNKNGIVGG